MVTYTDSYHLYVCTYKIIDDISFHLFEQTHRNSITTIFIEGKISDSKSRLEYIDIITISVLVIKQIYIFSLFK